MKLKSLFTPKASAEHVNHVVRLIAEAQKLTALCVRYDVPVILQLGVFKMGSADKKFFLYEEHAAMWRVLSGIQDNLRGAKNNEPLRDELVKAIELVKMFVKKFEQMQLGKTLVAYADDMKARSAYDDPRVKRMLAWADKDLTSLDGWWKAIRPGAGS